jgi:3-hydroxyacyl-[acyl-carrier-protein] dehydratase
MKFNLIDRVLSLTETRVVATKQVSLAEEYLADHFPTFPVLPGVMMIEAVTQAAAWLLHHRRGFAQSMVVLREARNVKYGRFVAPGDVLRVEVDYLKDTEAGATFKGSGFVGETLAISGRFELACFNLGDKQPELAGLDAQLIAHNRQRWEVVKQHSPIRC